MKRVTAITTLVSIAIPLAGVIAGTLSPTPVFDGKTTMPAKDGTMQTVHVIVQSWDIAGQDHATQEIPLRGFYLAHLLGGHISATIGGQTVEHLPGDYWTIKPGVKEGLSPKHLKAHVAPPQVGVASADAESFKDDPLIREALEIFKGEIKTVTD